ncbi:MAG: CHAD domain-containing protein [Nitrosospira sp.]|nr:CHAD domain-containing protein [Nitrosospira sp.]
MQTTRTGTPVHPAYRLLRTAVSEALQQLQAPQPISDEAIHDARKALKKARAALRLLQDGMSKTTYQEENSGLRDAGRFLSPLRDAKSLIDAFDSLHDRYIHKLQGVELAPLQKILRENLTKARRHLHLPGKSTELKNSIRLLKNCITSAKKKDFPSIDSATIDSGLRRIYRKGCKAQADAKSAQTTEALHEWRKQVKYLLNAVDGLHTSKKDNAGGDVAKILKRADQLADYLGDDHELAMLAQETARGTYASVDADVIKALHALIDRRRAKLQQRAFRSGKKLYDRKPKKFTKQAD